MDKPGSLQRRALLATGASELLATPARAQSAPSVATIAAVGDSGSLDSTPYTADLVRG